MLTEGKEKEKDIKAGLNRRLGRAKGAGAGEKENSIYKRKVIKEGESHTIHCCSQWIKIRF